MPSVSRFPEPQAVTAPLTEYAVFLVVALQDGPAATDIARTTLADVDALVRSVGFRSLHAGLTCVVGIGSDAWDRFGAPTRPRTSTRSSRSTATATTPPVPRATCCSTSARPAMDMCFELDADHSSGSVTPYVVDEVHGFRYFDARDLLGFVDGTENPTGRTRRGGVDRRPRTRSSPAAAT